MKIKTSELIGPALDWAVAKCEGGSGFISDGVTCGFSLHGELKVLAKGWAPSMSFSPSTDWAQGGPIIEREKIGTNFYQREWYAEKDEARTAKDECLSSGPTPLIAAMRCYAASKLGDEIDVPEEPTLGKAPEAERESEEPTLFEGQLLDLMVGIGASEDHLDVKAGLAKLPISGATVILMHAALVNSHNPSSP